MQSNKHDDMNLISSFEDAREWIYLYSNSYSRLGDVFNIKVQVSPDDFLKLLGEFWPMIDNFFEYKEDLKKVLPLTMCSQLMSVNELNYLKNIESEVSIYRCAEKGLNEDGLSWTLDKNIAKEFAKYNRYEKSEPILLSAKVAKTNIVAIKLDRNEFEVITFGPEIINREQL